MIAQQRQQPFGGADLQVVGDRKPAPLLGRKTSEHLRQQFSATVANVNPLRDGPDQRGSMLMRWVQFGDQAGMAIQQRDALRDLAGDQMFSQFFEQLLSGRRGGGRGFSSRASPLIARGGGHARMIAGEGGREQGLEMGGRDFV